MLGLDRGGSCQGLGFRIRGRDREAVLAHLCRREASEGEYHIRWLRISVAGEPVTGAAFVVNHASDYYAGARPVAEAARMVAQGQGKRGACVDYLRNTVAHLREMGIRDMGLERVLREAERLN